MNVPAPTHSEPEGSEATESMNGRSRARHRQSSVRARRTPLGIVSDLFLDFLALGGLICLIAVIAAFAFNITLIMFKTGSMTPTIPTGSLAVVQQIDARDIRPGDVITVDRDGQLPVTHRAVSIEPADPATAPAGAYTLVMQGDANDSVDPAPYTITQARKVLWHIPQLGYVVASASNPKVMAGMTMGMALLVTWAFWPRSRRVVPPPATEPADESGSPIDRTAQEAAR